VRAFIREPFLSGRCRPATTTARQGVGVGKPDPAVFTITLDMIRGCPEETVMIGDRRERDVLGALNVGIGAVWISRGRRPPEERHRVRVIDELTPPGVSVD
jgi:putative hydrolase of the HAD superfamily